ncbi:MAG: RNB domain-containing ribonuclease, partial [Desulfobacteraceae bacterium]|nr:RNB domain-containing ribonuclease [Desulfobacteraceae bacterium]
MESGEIVEYIDDRRIITAIVVESGNQRLKLLTEQNREIKVAAQRLSHRGRARLNPSAARHQLVAALRELSRKRSAIAETVDTEALWEILNQEEAWIDLHTMTGLCFPKEVDDDHESAVTRALFESRRYFRFKPDQFLPHTEAQVSAIIEAEQKALHQQQLIDDGAQWILSEKSQPNAEPPHNHRELSEILISFYLFDKESPHHQCARAIMKKAQLTSSDAIFNHLVAVGVWTADENVDLLRYRIPVEFSQPILDLAQSPNLPAPGERPRVDLTHLTTITIDGQSTLDFDDALSIETREDHYLVGIHISDVAHVIKKGDLLDQEARSRGSSIYMPDNRISMAPTCLAENRLSLKKDHLRPAISTMVKISLSGDVVSYDIFASTIRVDHQLTYFEANVSAPAGEAIAALYHIATRFREKRLDQGAIQIILPEVNIWLDESGLPAVNQINRESPSRMMIAEMMILSNWLSARFLSENRAPAIFRSQPMPKQRILKNGSGTLFQNWMQRKQLSRFVLRTEPEHHSGLGLDAYVTASSPIRKYFDLVTQRQVRAVLGIEAPYSKKEIAEII